eukprot:6363987-Ditylum_brightwellii.AAC.1
MQKHLTCNKVTLASSCIPVRNYFKPGGMMSSIQGDMVGGVIKSGSDEYGRWVYSKLAAKDKRVILVITAYQPCKASKKHGNTTYHQQLVQLQQAYQHICPRKAFMIDLLQFPH